LVEEVKPMDNMALVAEVSRFSRVLPHIRGKSAMRIIF